MMNARQNGFTLVEIALFFRMIAMLRDSYRKLEAERPLLAEGKSPNSAYERLLWRKLPTINHMSSIFSPFIKHET